MFSLQLLFLGAVAPAMIAALPGGFAENTLRVEYPEFIPLPGFPSLAELNLTTEMLHAPPKLLPIPDGYDGAASISSDFSIEYVDSCSAGGGGSGTLLTANVDDVIVCFNFLVALGNYLITVSESDQISGVPYFRQVAIYNSAVVIAHSLNVGGTASTAYDVALGVQWVFTNCNSGGQVAGSAAAYGNGDLVVQSSGYYH
ncbi:hypothetical protein N8I77_003523 [Diaporthe amygdali]|uniref:Uncharacterized protein n=1 Tax=Phomopsis amygdali TaxID=1214568 RepID=A0AAD9SKE4_PHOAM|nr:hypothetical protein N8I77_003523 [Diaporthe amygdali]